MNSRLAALLIGALFLFSPSSVSALNSTTEMTLISTHSHDPSAFTQGLEMHDGYLYESTGLYGHSSLRQVDPSSGEVLRIKMLDETYFGEGITIVNDSIYMLTWKQGKPHVSISILSIWWPTYLTQERVGGCASTELIW